MSSPSPSKALGKVAPASAAKDAACGAPSRLMTPTTDSRSPPASASCWTSGSSSRQGPHQLAQRFTTVGTPGARPRSSDPPPRSEEHTSELQSRQYLVCRLLLEKKKTSTCSMCDQRVRDILHRCSAAPRPTRRCTETAMHECDSGRHHPASEVEPKPRR